jgi:hypothetical protein
MRDDGVLVLKHTREETTETRAGRVRARTVTTWDVVDRGALIAECSTQREAFAARLAYRSFNNRHED